MCFIVLTHQTTRYIIHLSIHNLESYKHSIGNRRQISILKVICLFQSTNYCNYKRYVLKLRKYKYIISYFYINIFISVKILNRYIFSCFSYSCCIQKAGLWQNYKKILPMMMCSKHKKRKVNFPLSAIIYLRSDNTMGKYIKMTLNTPMEEAEYQIPLIKLKDYTLDILFEKHLFILLPFWIFTYENQLPDYENNENLRKKLLSDFRTILNRLQENCDNGIIDEYTKRMIIDMSKKVVRNFLNNKFPKIRKEVEIMFGGKVLDFEAKRIKDQAIKEGLEEGLARGRAEGLISLINILTSIFPNFDTLYEKIISEEKYKDVTREEVLKYYRG